jgi:hypothetical protein
MSLFTLVFTDRKHAREAGVRLGKRDTATGSRREIHVDYRERAIPSKSFFYHYLTIEKQGRQKEKEKC